MEKFYLQPGFLFVSEQPYYISTVLGSCVSVCIWDSFRQYGGMNHYIHAMDSKNQRSTRYGSVAIPHMLKLMFKNGSTPKQLRAHIIGGGHSLFSNSVIGDDNVAIACEMLKENGITVVTTDTGGQTGRKVVFNNYTGEIIVYKGINVRRDDWYNRHE